MSMKYSCNPAGLYVGIVGSAPYSRSSFMASRSNAWAARKNGVAPHVSSPSRLNVYSI